VDVEAVRWAHGNLTVSDFETVRVMIDKMEVLLAARDDFEAFDLHREIHFRIYAAAGSPVLMAVLLRLHEQSERFRHVAKSVRGTAKSVGDEHRMLLKALRTGTADDAAEIMSAHLLRTLDAIKSARARGRLSRPAASGL
jgi:DNA-binding GntR family transcriptional regulator